MIKSYGIQNNVNKIAKDGLKNLQYFVKKARNKHRETDIAFQRLECTIGAADENHEKLSLSGESDNVP